MKAVKMEEKKVDKKVALTGKKRAVCLVVKKDDAMAALKDRWKVELMAVLLGNTWVA